MKARVRLYGTLRKRFPGYVHARGMDVELPEGGTVQDLMSFLGISESDGAVVTVEGRILKGVDEIEGGGAVNVFQTIHGG